MTRSIDRALRPLFPQHFNHDISLTASVLSTTETDVDPDVVAINAASGALMSSDVPWSGPIGACKVAWIHGSHVLNPTALDVNAADFVMTFAGTRDKVIMIEAQGTEAPFDRVHSVLDFAQEHCQSMITAQLKLIADLKDDRHRRRVFTCLGSDPTAAIRVASLAEPMFEEIYATPSSKTERSRLRNAARKTTEEKLEDLGAFRSEYNRVPGSGCVSPIDFDYALMMVEDTALREEILKNKCRPDGRYPYDVRPLSCQVGSQMDVQKTFGPFGEVVKRFMFHYTFPSYAVNEMAKYKGVSRRETGHGALAERALSTVMPEIEIFPFPVRLVAETTASNGSSSMAAVCGGSLALVDAGVPIRSLIAGVSIGLITDHKRSYFEGKVDKDWELKAAHPKQLVLLTDIQGIEDRYGDMDFKITGTMKGVTALQLDIKLPGGIDADIVKQALSQAQPALMHILDAIKAIASSSDRPERPAYGKLNVDPETLGAVIGEAGKNIQRIESETGARIVLNDEGIVDVYAPSERQLEQAKCMVDDLLGYNIREGETYDAEVVKVFDYGAYVELPTGYRCLLHISQLVDGRVDAIEHLIQVGQMVRVKCIGRDVEGNISLTSKGLLQ